MPCEGVSAIPLISAASSSTCRMVSPSRIRHSGLQESHFPATREGLATQQAKDFGTIQQEIPHPHQTNTHRLFVEAFKRVKQPSIQTLVPLVCSCITNRYNISSGKPGITASVCLLFAYKFFFFSVDHFARQPSCRSRCYRTLQHQEHRSDSPLTSIHPIVAPFSSKMSSTDNLLRLITRRSMYVASVIIWCRL